MKRNKPVKKITSAGCVLVRHGKRNDLYKNPSTGIKKPIPGHNETDERLAKHIIKELT